MTNTKANPVKVSRDGTITRDGVTLGSARKVMRQGLFATAFGASYSTDGTPYWLPVDADGTVLDETGFDTRKRAVEYVEKNARPLTVESVKRETSWYGDRVFISAHVIYRGHSFGVSRYATEDGWGVDFYMAPGAFMPSWSNGTGDRSVRVRALSADLADAVTKAATEAGLWPITDAV